MCVWTIVKLNYITFYKYEVLKCISLNFPPTKNVFDTVVPSRFGKINYIAKLYNSVCELYNVENSPTQVTNTGYNSTSQLSKENFLIILNFLKIAKNLRIFKISKNLQNTKNFPYFENNPE